MQAKIIDTLSQIVGTDHVSTAASERRIHGQDQSSHDLTLPEIKHTKYRLHRSGFSGAIEAQEADFGAREPNEVPLM